MDEHLTREQIVRYVNRSGDVDDILAAAQHLDQCEDCRELAAVVAEERDHPR